MGDGADEWTQAKTLVKPPDQLELSEAVSMDVTMGCVILCYCPHTWSYCHLLERRRHIPVTEEELL